MIRNIFQFSSRKNERGQSLVEVAVSLPVILLLLVGTLDFGMAIFSYMILRDAAQEGALYGSFNPANNAEIERRARGISPHEDGSLFYSPVDLADENLVKVDIKTSAGKCQGFYGGKANDLEVSVTYEYPLMTPFMTQILGSGSIPITANATDVILQPPCP
jgi:hypothetical protein